MVVVLTDGLELANQVTLGLLHLAVAAVILRRIVRDG
jgi:hypothetical protein